MMQKLDKSIDDTKWKGGESNVVLAEGKGSGYGRICIDYCFDSDCCHYYSNRSRNPDFDSL